MRSHCPWSEGEGRCVAGRDSVTTAVEAARDALVLTEHANIGAVHLASTTLPFAARQNADTVALDISSSLRPETTGTELVTMEDLGLSKKGQAWKDVLDGRFDANGEMPCQINRGLKPFGHPIGASGLRVLYEMYLQLNERAGERQIINPRLA